MRALLAIAILSGACAAPGRGRFPDRAPLLVEPEKPFSPPPPERLIRDRSGAADDQIFFEWDRRLALEARPRAQNVNSLDEVPDSSFFVNRAAVVGPEDVRHGGEVGAPLDVGRELVVIQAKSAGVTGGMVVEDSSGQKFVLKFDPMGRYGLLSGCEAAASRLLWALGYNVPDNRVVYIEPARFVARIDEPGAPTSEQIAFVISRAARAPDGRIRALASRYIDGKILGPMSWRGVREGDPNDRVPHELRRELRGLRMLYVWINNPDAKIGNSLDAWVPGGDGAGIVKHYLLDLGTSLSSAGSGPARSGWWFSFAWRFGIWQRGTEDLGRGSAARDESRQVRRPRENGYLTYGMRPDVDPYAFEFVWYNAAFMRMDDGDAAWAARVIAALDEDDIRAAIEAADWPERVSETIVARLTARRRAVMQAIFARASSLGAPRIAGGEICADELSPDRAPRYEGARVDGTAVCRRVPRGDGYHVVRFRALGAGPSRELRVHVIRGGDEVRIVGVERD